MSPLKSQFKIWKTENVIDNKSRAKNIMIKNVEEKSTEKLYS